MTEAIHLSEALEGLFSQPDHGWFTPFSVATTNLTAVQAAQVPAPGFNSIWAITNHAQFWVQVVHQRLQGLPVDRKALGAEDGWPPPGPPTDEEAWQAARERAIEANRQLAGLVANLRDEDLTEPIAPGRARRHQVVQGLIAHNSYHTCEIISVRHMLGLWLERA